MDPTKQGQQNLAVSASMRTALLVYSGITLKMMVDDKVVTELPVLALEQVNQASIFGRAWDSLRLWLK